MAIKTFTTGEVLTASDTNTYLANSGLVYIDTVTLSGTSTSKDGVFTSTYDNYRLLFTANSTSNSEFNLFLRAGGANNTTANYRWLYQTTQVDGSGATNPVTIAGWNGTGGFYLSNSGNGGSNSASAWVELFSPNLATDTNYQLQTGFEWSGPSFYHRIGAGQFNGTTQFNGFGITSTATMTGTVVIYGYRKA